MNDKQINEFFYEHGSKDGSNTIYISCDYFGDDLSSALKSLLDDFSVVYFDLDLTQRDFNGLVADVLSPCIGFSLENLAEWKHCANMLKKLHFDILSYGIEEKDEL